ncbi:MAG: hypothetical protein JO189_25740, partial [Deltaproteobacteria bacterium]|nr:hypothetical protein [Deltaproteobacteria bacterium]
MSLQQYSGVMSICLFLLLVGNFTVYAATNLDQYGGVIRVACPNGPQPHFHTQKIGSRWWICDPAGHGFFMKGVAAINYNMDTEQYTLNQTKYATGPTTNWVLNWDLEMARRLQAWSFNTVADDSYLGVTPVYKDSGWSALSSDNTIPVKLPFTTGANISRYAFENIYGCGAPSPIKDLINGVGPTYTGWKYNYGDYFDPNFSTCVGNLIANGSPTVHSIAKGIHNDYLLYIYIDEGDQLGGLLGAGADFPQPDDDSFGGHASWITLVTAPTQTSNSTWGVTYSNTTVYTKQELSNFMAARHSNSITSLNAAWNSNYSSFSSAGGWGKGTGLLDENGTCPSKTTSQNCWIGNQFSLVGETSAMQADMSAFYVHYLDQYFSIMRSQWHNPTYGAPGVMLMMIMLGHNTPPRKEVLTEAAKYLDLVQFSAMPTSPWACLGHINGVCTGAMTHPTDNQARLDFIQHYYGDRPWINWLGVAAQPDSAESAHPTSMASYSTQTLRGSAYATNIANALAATDMATGTQHVVGFYWWGAFDQDGEAYNWGLLTPRDNPYDGCSATIAGCGKDQWGYPTGGEAANYGDFIGPVTAANTSVYSTSTPTPTPT